VSKANKRERQRENRERAREERERLVRRQKQMRTLRGLLLVLVPVAVVFVVVILIRDDGDSDSGSANPASRCTEAPEIENPNRNTQQQAPPQTIDAAKQYSATISTNCGTIELALDATTAPVATNNFVSLARQGFYNGTTFHRAARQFVIQGGDPNGDGSGGPGYSVVGEVPTDNYPVGSLAAAKTGADPAGSFGSQFFIVTGRNGASLPNDYARFGNVTKGMAVAKRITALAPENGDGPPKQKVVIQEITIQER
jgi:cyclophilin family peptidyl-prolyl cis-trans isomerase